MAIQDSQVKLSGRAGNLVGFRAPSSVSSDAHYARLYQPDVRDPETDAQLLQRACVATSLKAYSAFRPVLGGFFEGYAAGAPTFRRFLSVNVSALRSLVVDDIRLSRPVEVELGCVVPPDACACTPAPFIISDGSLPQQFLRHSPDFDDQYVAFATPPRDLQLLGAWLLSCDLSRGDVFTVAFLAALDVDGAWPSAFGRYASQPTVSVAFVRFSLRREALTSVARASSSVVGDAFDVSFVGCPEIPSIAATPIPQFFLPMSLIVPDAVSGFMGVVKTNTESNKASSCQLQTLQRDGTLGFCSQTGIKTSFLLNAWRRRRDCLGQSALVLEGGRPL